MFHVKYTSDCQPTEEQRAKAARTKSIRQRLNVELAELTLKDVFSEEELKNLHKNYQPKYADFEKFKDATAEHIIAYNFLKYVTQYGVIGNSENAMNIIRAIDRATLDDIKETLNPVINFDKYETLI
jgi:Mn-dependent DtxR family transcriptional regulator